MQLTTEILNETTSAIRESIQKMNAQIESMAVMLDSLNGQVPEKQIDYVAKYIVRAIQSIRQLENKTERIDDCLYYLGNEMNLLQTKLFAAIKHSTDVGNTNSLLVERISKLEAMLLTTEKSSAISGDGQKVGLSTECDETVKSKFDEVNMESKEAMLGYVASSMNTPGKQKLPRRRSRSASAKKILKSAMRRLSLSRDRNSELSTEIYTSPKHK